MIKRSEFIRKLQELTPNNIEDTMAFIEAYMQPKLRPLTEEEVEEHPLVKQVHHSKKDEVRNYVRNLDYEWKNEWLPE
jgi:hypothetical protein